MPRSDTIAAVSTPQGEGGIGIIRISGPEALASGEKVFVPPPDRAVIKQRHLYRGRVVDPGDGSPIDDGFLVYMRGPASFTGEDVVELQLHGGALVLNRALEAVLRSGARVAGPGEFTKRAFLNGKMDLTQAEAVIDIIRASSDAALASARARLDGALSGRINAVKEVVAGVLARIEAALDFPEFVEEMDVLGLLKGLKRAGADIQKLIETYDRGRALREGVRVLILGRPNVGKSSLLNTLLKEERAIVTPLPGTTRDVIEEAVNIRGVTLRLMDTAGLRKTGDFVESLGVKAARQKIEGARLILFVVDASSGDFGEDKTLLSAAAGKRVIIVVNKTDLVKDKKIFHEFKKVFPGHRVVFISVLKEKGIEGLEEAIYEEAAGHPSGGEADSGEIITSARHREALTGAAEGIERARKALAGGMSGEFAAADLRSSLTSLGELTGEVTPTDILDRIFSEFCIGK